MVTIKKTNARLHSRVNRPFKNFGWSALIQKFMEYISIKSHKKEDLFTCPSRVNHAMDNDFVFGRKNKNKNVDYWVKYGNDRCCSFCGSWHPEEFNAYIDKMNDAYTDGEYVEFVAHKGKFWISRKDVANAKEGAIKMFSFHLKKYAYDKNITRTDRRNMEQKIHNIVTKSSDQISNMMKPK